MPSNMAADTNHANFVVKSKYHKIFPLNEFPLKFRVQGNSVNFWHQQKVLAACWRARACPPTWRPIQITLTLL